MEEIKLFLIYEMCIARLSLAKAIDDAMYNVLCAVCCFLGVILLLIFTYHFVKKVMFLTSELERTRREASDEEDRLGKR